LDNSQVGTGISVIRKRNGEITDFDQNKIANAIYMALAATSKPDRDLAATLSGHVVTKLAEQGFTNAMPPSVEDIQDMVESTLIDKGYSEIAKAYIVYRHERRKVRNEKMKVLNLRRLIPSQRISTSAA